MKKIAISLAVIAFLSGCGGGDSCEPGAGIAVGALLSGCDGGSSDSNSTVVPDSTPPDPSVVTDSRPLVAMSVANYRAAGTEVLHATFDIGSVVVVSNFLSGVQVSPAVSFPQWVQMKYVTLGSSVRQSAYLSGVSVTDTVACESGGSMSLSGNVSNEDQATTGDVINASLNNCQEGGATINGLMTIRVLSAAGSFDSYPYTVDVEASTTDFRSMSGTASYQSNGWFTLRLSKANLNSSDASITIPSMVTTVSAGGKTAMHKYVNFKMETSVRGSITSLTMNGGVNVPTLGGNLVTIKTLQPFVSTTGYPTSGTVTATTALGGTIRMSAAPASRALIEFDAANDGVYETSQSISWNEIF